MKEKDGRRNRYSIQSHARLHEPTGTEKTIGEFLNLLVSRPARRRQPQPDRVAASRK